MEKSNKIGRISLLIDILMLGLGVTMAAIYSEKRHAAGLESDVIFVVLLIVASVFLVLAFRNLRSHVVRNGFAYWQHVIGRADGEHIENALRQLMIRSFHSIGRIISGVSYGLLVAAVVDSFDTIQHMKGYRSNFDLFIFSLNYLTGASLYSLVAFLTITPALIRNIPVQIWQTRNPAAEFMINTTLRIGVFAGVYVGISMTSILFSDIPIDDIVIVYALFSVGIVVVSIIFPMYFYAHRIQTFKDALGEKIAARLNDLSSFVLNRDEESESLRIDRMRELVQLQKWINEVGLIPFVLRTIVAAATIFLATIQPYIVDQLRDYLAP